MPDISPDDGMDNPIGASFDVRWETTPMSEHDGSDEAAAVQRRKEPAAILADLGWHNEFGWGRARAIRNRRGRTLTLTPTRAKMT